MRKVIRRKEKELKSELAKTHIDEENNKKERRDFGALKAKNVGKREVVP